VASAIYLYCVLQAPRNPAPSGAPPGLPGARAVEIVPLAESLYLVTAAVPLDQYGPGKLDTMLGDLDRVGDIALAHEEVVEHFAQRQGAIVVPMKLFTMFSSVERAVKDITSKRPSIDAAIEKIAGAEEWGIRVVRAVAAERDTKAPVAPRSGAAFLASKKQARDDVKNAKLVAATAATRAFERLALLSRDARRRDAAATPGATQPLLDAAFLVRSGDREKFTEAARVEAAACAGAGGHMIITGPWPAYNFIHPNESA
jgi:hypothetical protein